MSGGPWLMTLQLNPWLSEKQKCAPGTNSHLSTTERPIRSVCAVCTDVNTILRLNLHPSQRPRWWARMNPLLSPGEEMHHGMSRISLSIIMSAEIKIALASAHYTCRKMNLHLLRITEPADCTGRAFPSTEWFINPVTSEFQHLTNRTNGVN